MTAPDKFKRFVRLNFSLFVAPVLFAAVALAVLPTCFETDSRETTEELTAHLKTIRLSSSSADGGVVEFTTNLHPQTFIAKGLGETDLIVFKAKERVGNRVTFVVAKAVLNDPMINSVPVLRLQTENDVYLQSENVATMMGKTRAAAWGVFFICLGVTGWLLQRLRVKYLHDKRTDIPDEYSPLLLWVARNSGLAALAATTLTFGVLWSILPGGTVGLIVNAILSGAVFLYVKTATGASKPWVSKALAFEAEVAEAKSVRTATNAPKHVKAVQLLLKSGVDINIRNPSGQTALHIAVNVKSIEAVELLLQNGADVNAADVKGDTPLILATRNILTALVLKLLAHGADPLSHNAENETAMSIADGFKQKNEALFRAIKKATEAAIAKKEAEERAAQEKAEQDRKSAQTIMAAAGPQEAPPPGSGPAAAPENAKTEEENTSVINDILEKLSTKS